MPGPRSTGTSAYAQARVRQAKALELRLAGYSYRRIAQELGVNVSTAHRYVRKALQEVAERTQESAEQVLQIELQRLDELLRAVWERATSGDKSAIHTALRIMATRHKLLGLEAPSSVHVEHSGETAVVFKWVDPTDGTTEDRNAQD